MSLLRPDVIKQHKPNLNDQVVKTTASQGHEMYCSSSGGHGFEPWSGQTRYAVLLSKLYFNQKHLGINKSVNE